MRKQCIMHRRINILKDFYSSWRYAIPVLLIVVNIACTSNNSETNDTTENTQSPLGDENPLSELNIAKRLYTNQRIPDDFYHEPERDENNFYTIQHVKNTAIIMDDPHTPTDTPYEVCSDHFTQALDWSEQDALGSAGYAGLVDNRETDMFYEFTRVNLSEPQFIRLNRIFKCSFINRHTTDNTAGLLNATPLAYKHLKNAAEYLWTISPHNNYGYAVILTHGQDNESQIQHTLVEARMAVNVTANQCTLIQVFEILYNVEKANRKISITETELKQFSVKYENGEYTPCNS